MILSIIIVNYNNFGQVLSCLKSIGQFLLNINHEIIIIDNKSKNKLDNYIIKDFDECIILKNNRNIGFARAVNQGFKKAKGRIILILNPDVKIIPGSVEKAINFLETNSDVGILLPKLLNVDGTLQYSCRRFYTLPVLMFRRSPLNKFRPISRMIERHLMMDVSHDTVMEVDWGLGACMFIRRSVINGGQIFDERFFLYFEDVDLCFRMKQKGFKVIYFPEAVMIHAHMRQSARSFLNRAKWEHFISLLKFLLKHKRLKPR
ncbi:MAG: glycosyltransferase family 2 protein [Thermodesulfobacteriota bacterium]